MNNECKSCGHIFLESEATCPYCASRNPNFKESTKKIADDFIRRTENVFPSNDSWSGNSSNVKNDDSQINVCLMIFLVVVFWPAAIIYVIVKGNKK